MKKNKIPISHTSYDLFDEENIFLQRRVARKLNYFDLLNSCDIGLSTVMLKKTLILKHNLFPNLKTKEDYVLWLKISKSGILLDGIKKSLTIWTDRKNSLSKSTFQKIKDGFKVYYKYEKFNFLDSLFRVFILSINFLRKK
jgi:teichuronic acid biosynthesis glycosyltransferase TuaG